MLRTAGAIAVGVIVWLLCYAVLLLLYALLLGVSPSSRLGMAFIVFFAAGVGASAALGAMRKVAPRISAGLAYGAIGIFALMWLSGAAVVAPDRLELSFRLTSVVLALLGIGAYWKLERSN